MAFFCDGRYSKCDLVVSLAKVFEGDLADFNQPVIEGLPLPFVNGEGGNLIVEFVKAVNEAFDGNLDVVWEELETLEFDDDGEALDRRSDFRDEDRDDVVVRLVLEVDDGGLDGGRGVGSC